MFLLLVLFLLLILFTSCSLNIPPTPLFPVQFLANPIKSACWPAGPHLLDTRRILSTSGPLDCYNWGILPTFLCHYLFIFRLANMMDESNHKTLISIKYQFSKYFYFHSSIFTQCVDFPDLANVSILLTSWVLLVCWFCLCVDFANIPILAGCQLAQPVKYKFCHINWQFRPHVDSAHMSILPMCQFHLWVTFAHI